MNIEQWNASLNLLGEVLDVSGCGLSDVCQDAFIAEATEESQHI